MLRAAGQGAAPTTKNPRRHTHANKITGGAGSTPTDHGSPGRSAPSPSGAGSLAGRTRPPPWVCRKKLVAQTGLEPMTFWV